MGANQYTGKRDERERFDEKWELDPDTGCWIWKAGFRTDGYGSFGLADGRSVPAHQAAWLIYRGPIPPTRWVLHDCGRKPCVCPDDLYLGDRQNNTEDAHRLGEFRRGNVTRGNAKLSTHTVRRIRRLDCPDTRRLATELGVTQRTIQNILTGETWPGIE
jgi:hypothetical protein